MAHPSNHRFSPRVGRLLLVLLGLLFVGYLIGTPLLRHSKDNSSDQSSCRLCECDCSSEPLLSMPSGWNIETAVYSLCPFKTDSTKNKLFELEQSDNSTCIICKVELDHLYLNGQSDHHLFKFLCGDKFLPVSGENAYQGKKGDCMVLKANKNWFSRHGIFFNFDSCVNFTGIFNSSYADCAKDDPDMSEEMEKDIITLLSEEINLLKNVTNDSLEHTQALIIDAKKTSSHYQKEAEKCNTGMETCEEARERAQAALTEERKLSVKWEQRARECGWKDERRVYS
ncbi:unnamed protein product [Ilex paraguariensis]|uniref:Uncharacterized protein n=1 Tax=Ilex paraguariensis TaxID=185542 RepID=A0ABC8UEX0_9AQUA